MPKNVRRVRQGVVTACNRREIARPLEPERGSALGTAVRLRMMTTIAGRCVLAEARRALHERPHRCALPVVRHGLDHREPRAAIGACDERVPIPSVTRIRELACTTGAEGDIR